MRGEIDYEAINHDCMIARKHCCQSYIHICRSPYNDSECMLTPERSVEIQTTIGADIMMQLDDVVDATHTDPERFEQARHRTVRWLDRCIRAHKRC